MKNRYVVTGTVLLLLTALNTTWSLAQSEEGQPPTNGAKKPLEFNIPASAAFDLLGVNPASVMRPGNIRDFKVDWSFQSYRLRPNIAIQAQPLWEVFYNRVDLRRYQRASRLMKTLSTLDVSAGTVEQQVGENLFDRRLALAGKITLFRSHDPLDDADLFRETTEEFYRQREEIDATRRMLQDSLNRLPTTSDNVALRLQLTQQLTDANTQVEEIDKRQKTRLTDLSAQYVRQHWNASFVDVAVGKAYSFANPSLDSLRLTDDGWSAWVNACVGLGQRFLLSGLVRYTEFTSERLRQERFRQQYVFGLNLRYGSPKFNFFVEVVKPHTIGNQPDVSTATLRANRLTLAYGGDWRISRNLMLSYAVRTIYDQNFALRNLVPIASIACMMR